MADSFKNIKAGALAVPAFSLAAAGTGCSEAPPAEVQHVLWFFGHPEVYLIFAALILGPLIYILLRKFGRPRGILGLWVFGGLTYAACVLVMGLSLNKGIDAALHDTYYITAHYQYGLTALLIFTIFWAALKGFPRLLRCMYSPLLALTHFLLFFIGILLVFLPQFHLSMSGMPRRYVDYENSFERIYFLTNIGATLIILSLATFVILIIEALVRKRPVPHKAKDPIESAFE